MNEILRMRYFKIGAITILAVMAVLAGLQLRIFNSGLTGSNYHPQPWPMEKLKPIWRRRLIDTMKACACLPLIDVESSIGWKNPKKLAAIVADLDRGGVALLGFSWENGFQDLVEFKYDWKRITHMILDHYPEYFFPVTAAGKLRRSLDDPTRYLRDVLDNALAEGYPMIGEFYFRHYPSRGQSVKIKKGILKREPYDIYEPLDGPFGELLFQFSQKNRIPFQIHLEVEDGLLEKLEKMLTRYPGARVIWCHLGRVRYAERTKIYNPAYLERLIQKFPNLYFDLSAIGVDAFYVPSGQYCSILFDRKTRKLKPDWRAMMLKYPWRFMSALDLAPDRMDLILPESNGARVHIRELPPGVQKIIAYKAAWKLLFNEELKGDGLD